MDARLRGLAARQVDVVAAWQLLALGWPRASLEHAARRGAWQVAHRGVYALTQAPLTREQRWMAATLTTPGSVLSHASAGAHEGFRPWEGAFEVVTRPGSGGPRRFGAVLVNRSTTLAGATRIDGTLRTTTPERTLIDLAAHVSAGDLARSFREAIRIGATDGRTLVAALGRHRGRRGVARLAELVHRYDGLPYHRARSNAEARALEVLRDAGVEPPQINVAIAGHEADLVWPARRLIVEIDGPDFHRFADRDAQRRAAWEAAGFIVRRLPSGDVYDRPARIVALASDR